MLGSSMVAGDAMIYVSILCAAWESSQVIKQLLEHVDQQYIPDWVGRATCGVTRGRLCVVCEICEFMLCVVDGSFWILSRTQLLCYII